MQNDFIGQNDLFLLFLNVKMTENLNFEHKKILKSHFQDLYILVKILFIYKFRLKLLLNVDRLLAFDLRSFFCCQNGNGNLIYRPF